MIPLEKLLSPVSADSPAGPDVSLNGLLLELETLVQGKPETQFAPAEEASWPTVAKRCLEVAVLTRDLRVGAILATVLLRTEGLQGLHQGLQLLRGYLERFWPTVYPRPDEHNDPQERVNALNNLAAPPGGDGDWYRVVEVLRRTPLVGTPQTGRFGLSAWLAAKGLSTWSKSAGPAPSLAIVEGSRNDMPPDKLAADAQAAEGCLTELKAITELFGRFAGPAHTPTFDPLSKDLQQVLAWIGKVPPAAAVAGNGGAPTGGEKSARKENPGEIHSRDDVLRALEAIIEYYKAHEPSSPVPFLLHRVKRVVPLNFIDVIRELSPETVTKVLSLTGPLDGKPT